jgi:hypothetical protein
MLALTMEENPCPYYYLVLMAAAVLSYLKSPGLLESDTAHLSRLIKTRYKTKLSALIDPI